MKYIIGNRWCPSTNLISFRIYNALVLVKPSEKLGATWNFCPKNVKCVQMLPRTWPLKVFVNGCPCSQPSFLGIWEWEIGPHFISSVMHLLHHVRGEYIRHYFLTPLLFVEISPQKKNQWWNMFSLCTKVADPLSSFGSKPHDLDIVLRQKSWPWRGLSCRNGYGKNNFGIFFFGRCWSYNMLICVLCWYIALLFVLKNERWKDWKILNNLYI